MFICNTGSEYAALAMRLHALAQVYHVTRRAQLHSLHDADQDCPPPPPTRTLVLGALHPSILLRLDVAM
jgi:hypothetical protein